MTVYIEYAFLQNFALDGAILYLSFCAARRKCKLKNLLFSACLGAAFAVVFPLLVLPVWAAQTLKFSFGALMCLLAFGKVKNKKEWGRYAFICALFYVFTFVLGGALLGVLPESTGVWIFTLFALIFALILGRITQKIYQKRVVHQYIYDCEIAYKQRVIAVLGFLDSGNMAQKNGAPVCFLSPDIFYDLFGEELLTKERGQVRDEIVFQTLTGEKKTAVFKAELFLRTEKNQRLKKQAYFAPSANMLNREYSLLLNGELLDEGD